MLHLALSCSSKREQGQHFGVLSWSTSRDPSVVAAEDLHSALDQFAEIAAELSKWTQVAMRQKQNRRRMAKNHRPTSGSESCGDGLRFNQAGPRIAAVEIRAHRRVVVHSMNHDLRQHAYRVA
jgi:hypothetical protein